MKLVEYVITPKKIEFMLEAENDAEIALLEFCHHQAVSISPDGAFPDRIILSGVMAQ